MTKATKASLSKSQLEILMKMVSSNGTLHKSQIEVFCEDMGIPVTAVDDIAETLKQKGVKVETRRENHHSSQNETDLETAYLHLAAQTISRRRVAEKARKSSAVTDVVQRYLDEIASIPVLTPEMELALARIIQRGVAAAEELLAKRDSKLSPRQRSELKRAVEHGALARDLMIEANLKLVVAIAKKYRNKGLPFPDLIQEGNLGLLKAVERFDPSKGFRFSTYASWWIKQSIVRAISLQSRLIRLPGPVLETVTKVVSMRAVLRRELQREPTAEEIAEELGMPLEKVSLALSIDLDPISLDRPVGDDLESTLGDIIQDHSEENPDEAADRQSLSQVLKQVLESLDARQREILALRFGLEDGRIRTLDELASRFNITRERIRQIENHAITRLRNPAIRARLLKHLGSLE